MESIERIFDKTQFPKITILDEFAGRRGSLLIVRRPNLLVIIPQNLMIHLILISHIYVSFSLWNICIYIYTPHLNYFNVWPQLCAHFHFPLLFFFWSCFFSSVFAQLMMLWILWIIYIFFRNSNESFPFLWVCCHCPAIYLFNRRQLIRKLWAKSGWCWPCWDYIIQKAYSVFVFSTSLFKIVSFLRIFWCRLFCSGQKFEWFDKIT